MDGPDDSLAEEVVLFPLRSHDPAVKVLRVARVTKGQLDEKNVQHFAGGPYKGIIVSKAIQELPKREKPEAVREFLAHVQSTTSDTSGEEMKEKRKVFMWFKGNIDDKEIVAEKFFRRLIDPDQFPKDYISFVKKVILLARSFESIRTLELEMYPAPDGYGSPPVSPGYGQGIRDSWISSTGKIQQADPQENGEGDINLNETPKRPKKDKPQPPPRATLPAQGETNVKETYNNTSNPYNEADDAEKRRNTQEDMRKTEESFVSVENYPQAQNDIRASSGVAQQRTLMEHHVLTSDDNKKEPDDRNNKVNPVPINEPTLDDGEIPLTEEEIASRRQHVLLVLEDAFPTALKAQDIAEDALISDTSVKDILLGLKDKGLAQEFDDGRWIRVSTIKRKAKTDRQSGSYTTRSSYRGSISNHDFQVVPQMPILPDREQPTVAVITLLYCEKQAVDSMMDHRTTYVRYKTGAGENQVYTIGIIGSHKVVSTKLSRVGTGQGATVSAGNTITRLLGTFGKIDHVFLVGIGGGIPNYTDDAHHVRCGDVVISKPQFTGAPTYVYVTDAEADDTGGVSFGTQFWEPKDETVSSIVNSLAERYGPHSMTNSELQQNIQNGLADLGNQELSFSRPRSEYDRLYKVESDGAWLEVSHPEPQRDSPRTMYPDRPVVHFGSIGSGFDRLVKGAADWRQEFALFNDILALDSGFQAVMESIDGNRKNSFWIIRGIADYTDGMSCTEWQPYAALVAAAAMKTMLLRFSGARF